MNPYTELIQNSKCEIVKSSEFTSKISKIDNQLFDIYEFSLSDPISLNERLILENSKMKIRLKHNEVNYSKDQHGVLLILVHYNFAFVSMKSKLNRIDEKRSKFLSYGETSTFEDQLNTQISMTQMSNLIKYEIPSTFYEKEKSYLEAEFSLTDKFMSIYEDLTNNDKMCWPINLMIEYIPPGSGANKQKEEDFDVESKIELITPAILNDIPITDDHNLTLKVSLDTSITTAYPNIDPASSLSGTMLQQMCALELGDGSEFDFYTFDIEGLYSKTNTIFPTEYSISYDYKEVFLYFPVSQAYEDSCYKLVCKKDPTIIHGTFYNTEETAGIETKYCFSKENKGKSLTSPVCDQCNPLGTTNCNSKGK